MEQYNWIKAYYKSQNDGVEDEVFVRQVESCSGYFISDKGNRFHISELDLTRNTFEPHLFNLEEFEKRNKELDAKFKANQEIMNKMLSSLDANAIADHKAKIDEREYWRKLRGEIFLEYCRRESVETTVEALKVTGEIVDFLYKQDQEFFKDK